MRRGDAPPPTRDEGVTGRSSPMYSNEVTKVMPCAVHLPDEDKGLGGGCGNPGPDVTEGSKLRPGSPAAVSTC